MQSKLSTFDNVLTCKGKASLYLQLSQNIGRLTYRDDSETEIYKQRLTKALGSINHPKAIEGFNQETINIINEMKNLGDFGDLEL